MTPYELGTKIAIEAARPHNLTLEANNPLSTAEDLAQVVQDQEEVRSPQKDPVVKKPTNEVDYEGPGYSTRSISSLFDNLSTLGIEMTGPGYTSV